MAVHIEDLFEEKARKGDSGFAIAFALMRLARTNEKLAKATQDMGLGDASSPMGAIELLAKEVRDGAQAIEHALLAATSD